ncbi:TetR/AcrR family transcriptional regulator [Psychrobacillus psychrodurans]|uniref:TetR/AcrR family transcriptional regulator n=1 Tax=Psychrobacillus psychrodurans TaxID=126157 RepID=UPI0008DEB316|nr:TetR/AcrR family transcriptional regulator [Psychrobacillus psychrodurans]SFN25597.1 DNA-binding transcriptional regulator, AcrR family [Psychrobacillus psychrodurans]
MNTNSGDSQKTFQRGRPRSIDVDKRIIDATLNLLAEVGVEKISIETIATKAEVGKSSIYRRWKNKDDLILDALEQLKPEFNISIKGKLDDILFELSQNFAEQMNNPLGKQMLSLLISTLSSNSKISESYWENHSLPKTKEISNLLQKYIEEENIRKDVNLDLISEFLIGFIIYQLLLKPSSADLQPHLRAGIDMVLNGIKENN